MVHFSIIVPCYNAESFLHDTFGSLALQTFKDFEVIAVDDKSGDKSYEVACQLLIEKRLKGKVLRKPAGRGQGVASTRNYAIEQATGTWLCFLDSDDIFHPKKLTYLHCFIETQPQVKAICHKYSPFQKTNDIQFEEVGERGGVQRYSLDKLVDGNIIGASTVCLSRQLYEKCGPFDARLNGVEDYMLWLKVARLGDWIYLDETLTYYRESPGSLMGQRPLAYYVDQNFKLWSASREVVFFSKTQLDHLYTNLFSRTMSYYVGRSLNSRGYVDFFTGVLALAKRGLIYPAFYFFFRDCKQRVFKMVSMLQRR